MTQPAGSAKIKVRDDAVVWREVDEEVVLLHLLSSDYMALNPSAAVLWPPMVEGTTRDELVERLVEEFELTSEQATTDVDAFLEQCRTGDLLEP